MVFWLCGTSLKRTLKGQKFLSALERCPWRGLNSKVPKFNVRLFYTGPTLTRTPPPPYLTMGIWNGEKEVIFFCNVSVYLTSKLFSYYFQRFIYFAILVLPGKIHYSIE